MNQDPTSGFYYGYQLDAYPEHVLIAVDRDTGEPVAKALTVPLSWAGDIADGLPEGRLGLGDPRQPPTTACAARARSSCPPWRS